MFNWNCGNCQITNYALGLHISKYMKVIKHLFTPKAGK